MKSLRSSVFALMLGAALPAYLMVPAQAQVAIDVSVDIRLHEEFYNGGSS